MRPLLAVIAVRFFLEIASIGSAIDFRSHAAGKFLDLAERVVFADEAGSCAPRFAIERLSHEVNLKRRFIDGQEQLFGFDGGGGLRVSAEDVRRRFLLVVLPRRERRR